MSSSPVDLQAPEPLTGSYFVATYPPFSSWDEEGAREYLAALGRPPVRVTATGPTDAAAVADNDGELPALGLYVHIPFCVKRCDFCYYLSYDEQPEALDAYVDAVVAEAQALADTEAISGRRPAFVYVGGGTPSALSERRIDRLLRGIRAALPWDDAREITFECAPRTVTADKLRLLREHGVTRVSMGVQQFDDEILRLNGRIHRVADVERAWEAIAGAGFPVANLDLIVGLVGETEESFFGSLERLIRMSPESITVYQLEIPLNTPLYQAIEAGTLEADPVPWATKRERLVRAFERLAEAGYQARSAYTAVRDPDRHRFVYQDEQYAGADLLGIGASSFSHVSGVQHQNLAGLRGYLRTATEGALPLWRGHRMTPEEAVVREMVLQWKLGRVDRAGFMSRHGVDPVEHFAGALQPLLDATMARIEPDAIVLTLEGLAHADRVLPVFYLPEHRGIRYS